MRNQDLNRERYEDTHSSSNWLQLVVPHTLREEVLEEIHERALKGHLGEEKSLHKLKERLYWPGMQQDIHNWCKICKVSATKKSAPKKKCAPLQKIKTGYPMEIVAVDILGPLKFIHLGRW